MTPILALFLKDLRLFFGDRRAVLIAFLVPIGIASFFASIFGDSTGPSKATKIPILVVDRDGSPLIAKIVAGLGDAGTAPKLVTEAEAAKAVEDGKAGVAVTFPKGFGEAAPKAMLGGTPPPLDLRYDPSKRLEMQVVQGAVAQATMRATAVAAFGDSPTAGRPPFALETRAATAAKKGEDDDYSQTAHSFAGMAMQGVLFFGINAAMAMLGDRRKGIWRRLRAAPVGLTELLVGKALATALIGAFVLAGVLGFGMLVFHLQVAGSWLGLALIVASAALMTSAFGLLVASLGRTEEQSRGLSILVVLAMTMLGGAWFPSFLMPAWVQSVSRLVPVRWALDGFDAMLWRGKGLEAALTPVAGLLAFTLVFGLVAAFRFRTMPETA